MHTQENSEVQHINAEISELEDCEKENISDGYHTFKELYAHRIALYIALIHAIHEQEYHPSIKPCWKSKLHSD